MAAALLCMGMLGMQAQTLQFNSNKKFKIVQFTDVHWVPGNPASEEAAERMNEILDAEKPDLVIYTGDLIFAKPAAEGLDKALEPTISRHIPFAVTWGNHDDEQDMTRTEHPNRRHFRSQQFRPACSSFHWKYRSSRTLYLRQ